MDDQIDGGSAASDSNRGRRSLRRVETSSHKAFCGCDGSNGSWRSSLRWVKSTSHEICWVATGLKRCSHETVFGGETFFESLPAPHKMSNQGRLLLASPPPPPQSPTPPPPLPPQPPQPHHRIRNRCPCGECFVRREFNSPGECSFRAKAPVAVSTATTAIAITAGECSHQRLHQPLPPPTLPKSRRLRLFQRTLLSRRCRQGYSSWGSGSVTEGGARRRYRRGRRQV